VGSRVMAIGSAVVAAAAGKGTGAISRGAFGDDGSAVTDGCGTTATSTEETADLGTGLCAASGDGGFGAGFIADAVAAVALYPGPDCGVGPSMTAGLGMGAADSLGAAGLRSLA